MMLFTAFFFLFGESGQTGFQVTVLHVYIFQTFITDGCQIQYQQQWCFRVLQKEIHQKLNFYTDVVQLGMCTN